LGRLNRLTRLFYWLRRSFWLLPMLGCIGGVVLAGLAHWADAQGVLSGSMTIGKDTVRDLLGTVAGATATMMSLAYTLTLLIFTLAAGQLGPRLLDSFYDNRVNQIAISVMGMTLTFALVGMAMLAEGQEAQVTGLVVITFAVLTVGTLIYFVHDVSQRVLIDNEIALTAKRLDAAIAGAFRLPDDDPEPQSTLPDRDARAAMVIHAAKTGYLRSIDLDELVGDMHKHDAMVEIVVAPGAYIVTRMPVALVHRRGDIEDWERAVNNRLVLGRSRSSEGDILFSVNLLVEITLRALSPGVNDSFTAISAIDHLSGAFADLAHRRPASPLHIDGDGVARVMAGVLTVDEVIDTALHPIRRDAAGNLLVSAALLRAIRRIIAVADAAHIPMLRDHARLVGEVALSDTATTADRAYLDALLLTILPDGA